MAATVTSAWSKPGAWALDSEEHEEELQQQHQQDLDKAAASNLFKVSAADNKPALSDFPALSAASTTKTKKKKGQTLSLSEFSSYSAKPAYQPKGFTNEDLMNLPTGPRERTAEELDRSRLGGGFRSYGDRGDSSNSRWGSNRSSDEPRRQGGFGKDSDREFVTSRADEVDDWGAGKKSSSFGGGFERRERGERGGFFDSQSRADESDSWSKNKSFVPSEGRRFGSTGGGFERRGGFPSNGGGGAADSDNWGKKKEEEGRSFGANGGGSGGGAFDSLRERRGGYELGTNGVDSDSWGKKREEVSVNGGGGGGGRPKLTLQPRRVPIGENVPSDSTVTMVKPKGSNPFGDARPREEVLKEKGQDWKEVDEKIEASKIKELASPVGSMDGPSFGKRSFGSGNGRGSLPEDRSERSWRKAASVVDARPPSAEKTENGHAEEAEDNESQM
ncbi:hypothetical protein LguiA_027623 [Lonicera macranthoides]